MAMEKQKAEQHRYNTRKTTAKVCAKTLRIGPKGQIRKLKTSKSNEAGTSGFDLLNLILNLNNYINLLFNK